MWVGAPNNATGGGLDANLVDLHIAGGTYEDNVAETGGPSGNLPGLAGGMTVGDASHGSTSVTSPARPRTRDQSFGCHALFTRGVRLRRIARAHL